MHQPCVCLIPFIVHTLSEKEVNCMGTFLGIYLLDGWCMFAMFVTVSLSPVRRITNEMVFVTQRWNCVAQLLYSAYMIHLAAGILQISPC